MRTWIGRLLLGKDQESPAAPAPGAKPDWREEPSTKERDAGVRLRKILKSAVKDMLDAEGECGEQPALNRVEDVDPQVRDLIAKDIKEMGKFGAAFERFRALNDPNSSLADIAKTVGTDPVFSARVLAVANSPYFNAPETVTSVHHAVLVLGMVNLKTLYFREYFKMLGAGDGRIKHLRRQVWVHLGLTAVCAFHVAGAVAGVEPVTAYTLGLLHDVGKFPLLNLPLSLAESRELYDLVRMPGEPCREDGLAGINHALAGRMACERWRFPHLITEAIAGHHIPEADSQAEDAGEVARYVACLRVANQLARLAAAEDPGQAQFAPLPACAAALVNQRRLQRLVAGDAFLADLAKTTALFMRST